jgi:hypothetical protein
LLEAFVRLVCLGGGDVAVWWHDHRTRDGLAGKDERHAETGEDLHLADSTGQETGDRRRQA